MNALCPPLLVAALATASLFVSAQAQPSPQRVLAMNPQQEMTAFFYRQPVVLDRTQHASLRLRTPDARFAAHNPSVPLVLAEFAEAALEYPIVFVKSSDGPWLALALTGLQTQTNAFVDPQGKWNARYVPASVRRYPFILSEDKAQQLSLAVDMAATHTGPEGEPLFDAQGEPAQGVRDRMSLLTDFQAQLKLSEAFIQQLDAAGVLVQQNLQVRMDDGRQAAVDGVWIVDEQKLRESPDDKALAWFKSGELSAIHAHLLSLRNLIALLERHGRPAPAPDDTQLASSPAQP